MRIYLVEDDAVKATAVETHIKAVLANAEISIFRSYNTGLAALKNDPPDLLVLDMTLPSFDRTPADRAGRVRPLGGYELLRKLKLFQVDVPFVVVSMLEKFGEGAEEISFADMSRKCASEFPNQFLGSVYYETGGDRWRDNLSAMLENNRNTR